MKVCIAGSRGYPRLDLVRAYVRGLPEDTVLICGMAPGVDMAAYRAALRRGWRRDAGKIVEMEADWRPNGLLNRSAGHIRNAQMAAVADAVVCFLDNRGTRGSPGTLGMIAEARRRGVLRAVYDAEGQAMEHGA